MQTKKITPRHQRDKDPIPLNLDERIRFTEMKLQEMQLEKEAQSKEKDVLISEKIAELEGLGLLVTAYAKAGTSTKEFVEPIIETEYETELKPWYHISSQKGLFILLGAFAATVLIFAWYGVFVPLNDSEIRITNAAMLHFVSHVWLGIAVLLLGFGFQFAAFNEQFRYLWSNCETEYTASIDFQNADTEGKTRLAFALVTWAFPVWIFTQMFQLILG